MKKSKCAIFVFCEHTINQSNKNMFSAIMRLIQSSLTFKRNIITNEEIPEDTPTIFDDEEMPDDNEEMSGTEY